jgi:hypothetical protein
VAQSQSAIDVDTAPAKVAASLGVFEHLVRRAGAAVLAIECRCLSTEAELVSAMEADRAAPACPYA